jgi:hypothetical protein
MGEEEDYSPYCKICSACGEDGCCPALICTMDEGCEYKSIYLGELKESYSLMKDFYKHIYNKLPEDLKIEFNKLEETNWEYWNGKDRTNN